MDGNGRWATRRFLPRIAGHRQGLEALRRCVRASLERGIEVMTVFAFSSENWQRPSEEVSGLMDLLGAALQREVPTLQEQGVQVHFVGDRSGLARALVDGFEQAERLTAANQGMVLNICFNYGGRWDVVQAARRLLAKGVEPSEETLSAALSLAHVPDPDLLIRTGGDQRVSNFLLWQLAYTEMVFSETLWPDFDERALDAALLEFGQRERRFGRTSEQARPAPARAA